jgi:hypothetical protein
MRKEEKAEKIRRDERNRWLQNPAENLGSLFREFIHSQSVMINT